MARRRVPGLPKLVRLFPQDRIFSLDVECVAIGLTHEPNSRAPCRVALVDGYGKVRLHGFIRPAQPIVSYLTPFTGLKPGDLDHDGVWTLEEAIEKVKAELPQDAILVGYRPEGDADWMQLEKSQDYADTVNLAVIFRSMDGRYRSLEHAARVLLSKERTQSNFHDPRWDATASVALYLLASEAGEDVLANMRVQLTTAWPPTESLVSRLNYKYEGVCLSMHAAEFCTCGRPMADEMG